MLGDGISLLDLAALLKSIREKDLLLEVKVGDGQWEGLTKITINKMLATVTSGEVTQASDIRLRLFAKGAQQSVRP